MKKSGEARIIEKILVDKAQVIHDQGGAVILEFNPGYPLKYFFIGKHYVGLTSETYYVTIAVHEFNRDTKVKGRARIVVRKGFLGLGSKVKLVQAEESIGEKISSLVVNREFNKRILRTPYEEIVVRIADKKEVSPQLGSGKALVIIGKTSIVNTLFPKRFFEKIIFFNIEFMDKLIKTLCQ